MQGKHDALGTWKDKLISAPVLATPCYKGHLTLFTDACNEKMGGIWLQEQPDRTKSHSVIGQGR